MITDSHQVPSLKCPLVDLKKEVNAELDTVCRKGTVLLSLASVVSQKSLSFVCHPGLDTESIVSELDSRFHGNDDFGVRVATLGLNVILIIVVVFL